MSEVAAARQPIRALPALLVNQIAAGEVVERPASVVKELVENAIDAGARRISVEIEQGGVELVRITDDGCGIPAEELPLAIAPHATSKIASPEDLDRIATMGFRGEAIASIAAVSRMTLRSRTAEMPGAAEIEIEGDRVGPVRPAPGPMGTAIGVRNLFFNTPARRKFLRTPPTEQGHCVDAACTLAIAHPHISFLVVADGRTLLDVPPAQGPRERVLAVLGTELAEQMLEVSADRFDDARGLTLWGLIGLPAVARATPKAQHVFLNGRPIRDRTIQHALREAYRGLIEPGRYPTAVVMLEMDPGAVDVNVHPAKAEVRFRDQSMVHQAVLRAVQGALRAADLTPAIEAGRREEIFGAGGGTRMASGDWGVRNGPSGSDPGGARSFVDFFRREIPERVQNRFEYQAVREAIQRVAPGVMASEAAAEPTQSTEVTEGDTEAAKAAEVLSSQPEALPTPEPKDHVLQVHNSYVVTQDEHGLVIVDQHALHERVMFEVLLARIMGGVGGASGRPDAGTGRSLESQRLLTPAVVHVPRSAAARLDDMRPLLDKIGVACELMTPESVGVHAFPTFLLERGVEPGEFMAELFEKADAEGFWGGAIAGEAALHEVLDMMACKAAVKAGDRMSQTELADLLRLRDLVERSSNCPHGRPTSIRLTVKELDRRFGRT